MKKPNEDLRNEFKNSGICAWQIARKDGISESTMCIWLRDDPIPPERKKRIMDAFEALKKEGAAE